jgi:hypothetical protein
MDNKSGRKAGMEIMRSHQSGSFRCSEVQLRTRWTSTEQSARLKNACSRFAERGLSQMRDFFTGAHSQRHGGDASDEQRKRLAEPHPQPNAWPSAPGSLRAQHTVYCPRQTHSDASLDTQGAKRRVSLYEDDLFEIFDAEESLSDFHPRSHAWYSAPSMHGARRAVQTSSRQYGWDLSCPARLELTVLCGRNLKAADGNGTSDPFVRMQVGSAGKTQQTSVAKTTVHPQWNEAFSFEIDSANRHECLYLECFDHDMFSGHDSLGTASFALAQLQPDEQCLFWCRLVQDENGTTRGEVQVQCTLVPRPAGPL